MASLTEGTAGTRLAGAVQRCAYTSSSALTSLSLIATLRASVYLWLGPGLILDDWTAVGNREFHGVLEIADHGRLMSRPIEWLTYTIVYGAGGTSPVALFLIVTLLNLIAVGVLLFVLRRYLSSMNAWLICSAWILVPNHNALTVWAANTQSLVAFIFLGLGAFYLSRGLRLAPAVLLALSVLGYQLTIIPALAAVVLVDTPLLRLRNGIEQPDRALSVGDRIVIAIPILAGVAWTSVEPTYPLRISGPRPWTYLSAHFGEGLFARAVPPVLYVPFILAAVIGIVFAAVLWHRGETDRDGGPGLVVAGLGVMLVGSLGVVLSGSQAFGMTDRLYAITSIGAVMIWIGIARMLYEHASMAWCLAAAAVWGVSCVYGQWTSMSSWSQAGDDVVALMNQLDEVSPSPSAALVVGPEAIRRNNVVGIVSPHAPDNALWLHRGQVQGSLRIAKVPAEFIQNDPAEVLITWNG